jgi:hypothetical protein
VKTEKFTEGEAKDLITKSTQSGTDTTDTAPTADTTDTAPTADTTDTAPTADTTTTSNTDTSANETHSPKNEDNKINNNQSSSINTDNPENYDELNELVHDIKNGVVDTDEISLNTFKDSRAYQGANKNTQDCIDLAGKIGDNLIDYEIVRCSEDTNFFQNQIVNTDDNNDNTDDKDDNNDDNNKNADDTGI